MVADHGLWGLRGEFETALQAGIGEYLQTWHTEHKQHSEWRHLQPYPTWPESLTYWITCLHFHNWQVWEYEDYCRGDDDNKLIWAKRNLDRHNQLRVNAVEKIDEELITNAQRPGPECPVNSETVGSIIDRISVNALKLYHTLELRGDQEQRLSILRAQDELLTRCASELVAEIVRGTRMCVPYKQLKMYNDPVMNKRMTKEYHKRHFAG